MGTDLWQQTVTFAVERRAGPKGTGAAIRSSLRRSPCTSARSSSLQEAGGGDHRRDRAAEELVAELGAAFLCAEVSIDGIIPYADYIGYYLEILEDDPRAIFTAAARAQSAVDFLRQQLLASPQRILRLPFEASKLTTGGAACVSIFATTAASLSSTMTEVTRSLSRP